MEDESNACQSFYGTTEWLSQHIWVLKQEADRVQRIIDAMEEIPSSSTDELMLYTGIKEGLDFAISKCFKEVEWYEIHGVKQP